MEQAKRRYKEGPTLSIFLVTGDMQEDLAAVVSLEGITWYGQIDFRLTANQNLFILTGN